MRSIHRGDISRAGEMVGWKKDGQGLGSQSVTEKPEEARWADPVGQEERVGHRKET